MSEYLGRLKHYANVEYQAVQGNSAPVLASRMLQVSEGSLRIVLDERGKQWSSTGLAEWIRRQQLAGTKRASILIGGANGHLPEVREAAQEVWSLSALTLQHEMALLIFLEQIYRAYTILKGEPYHRG